MMVLKVKVLGKLRYLMYRVKFMIKPMDKIVDKNKSVLLALSGIPSLKFTAGADYFFRFIHIKSEHYKYHVSLHKMNKLFLHKFIYCSPFYCPYN